MDRREALKRLGTVGVTAAAASVIVSSPAFADGGSNNSRPTVPGPPTMGAFVGATTSATFAAASCPTPSPGPTSARIDYSIYQTGGSGSLGGTIQSPGSYSVGNTTVSGDAGGRTAPNIQLSGTSVTLRIDVRYVCREPGGAFPGPPAWSCRSFTRTYSDVFLGVVYSGGAWGEINPTGAPCTTPT